MAEIELPNPQELHEQAEDRFGRRVALVTAVFAVILSTKATEPASRRGAPLALGDARREEGLLPPILGEA